MDRNYNKTFTDVEIEQNQTHLFTTLPGFLTDEEYALAIVIFTYINFTLTIFGIGTNGCNIALFLKLGVRGNTNTALFFALSLSDITFLFVMFWYQLFVIIDNSIQVSGFPLEMFALFVLTYAHLPYGMSIMITVFLTIQKCCCVAMPLHFKNTFTPSRSYIALGIIVTSCLSCYLPFLLTFRLGFRLNPLNNRTELIVFLTANRAEMTLYADIFLQNILPTVSQVIVIACLLVIFIQLRKASQFRQQLSQGKKTEKEVDHLTGKDLQVVRSVILITVIFLACNLPTVFVIYAKYIDPEFYALKRYNNLYGLTSLIRVNLQILCASLNILVYYKFHSKFRAHAQNLCCRSKSKELT